MKESISTCTSTCTGLQGTYSRDDICPVIIMPLSPCVVFGLYSRLFSASESLIKTFIDPDQQLEGSRGGERDIDRIDDLINDFAEGDEAKSSAEAKKCPCVCHELYDGDLLFPQDSCDEGVLHVHVQYHQVLPSIGKQLLLK